MGRMKIFLVKDKNRRGRVDTNPSPVLIWLTGKKNRPFTCEQIILVNHLKRDHVYLIICDVWGGGEVLISSSSSIGGRGLTG